MPFVNDYIAVRSLGPDNWVTIEGTEYRGRDETFYVPSGFLTDFASVPRVFTWLIPRYGVYTQSAILHDYFCNGYGGVSRHDADGLFRRSLAEFRVSLPRRWLMWAAVRTAGRMSDATLKEWMQYLLVILLAVPFLIVPVAIVQLWLIIFWVLEKAFSPRRDPEASAVWTQ